MVVGKLGSSTGTGLPRMTVTPGGVVTKVRMSAGLGSAATVAKLMGLLKVTEIAPGVAVTTEPLAGLVDATRSTSTALMALMALMLPKPAVGSQTPLGVPFIGVPEAIRPARISAGVAVGTRCFIRAATAA